MRRQNFPFFSKAFETPQQGSSSLPHDPTSPEADVPAGQPSRGDIREAFGFDRDDPNVKVEYMTLGGMHPRDLDAAVYRGGNSEADHRCGATGEAATETLSRGGKPVIDPEPRAETPYEKWERQAPAVVDILTEVMAEVSRAVTKHRPMASPHEGYSVILEELDELWEHVKGDTARSALARKEAIQIACTAVRYVLDLDPH